MTTQADPSDEFANNLVQALMMGNEDAHGYEVGQPHTWESASMFSSQRHITVHFD